MEYHLYWLVTMDHSTTPLRCRSLLPCTTSVTSPAVPITPRVMVWPREWSRQPRAFWQSLQTPTWLSYRASPLPWCGLSPAELLMGRRLQTDIPQPKRVFIPDWPYLTSFCVKDEEQKRQQKAEYDRHHRVKPLPPLPYDELVWVRTEDRQVPGRVVQQANTPRSYMVESPSGIVRRNQSHLSPRSG